MRSESSEGDKLRFCLSNYTLLFGGPGGGMAVYAKVTATLRKNGGASIPLARFKSLVCCAIGIRKSVDSSVRQSPSRPSLVGNVLFVFELPLLGQNCLLGCSAHHRDYAHMALSLVHPANVFSCSDKCSPLAHRRIDLCTFLISEIGINQTIMSLAG